MPTAAAGLAVTNMQRPCSNTQPAKRSVGTSLPENQAEHTIVVK
jgi:hypothetical protein